MGIPQHFSATYSEARAKFLDAARSAGASIESHLNPNARGAQGEELVTDVARFGAMDAEHLYIACSATHGNEGFCGSGCQIGFIKEGVIASRPKSVAVLLIHAINPYGFSHVRRVTEDNVDLNRNFQDFSKPLPVNARYPEIHDLLVPPDWDGPGRANAEKALQEWIVKNGMPAFQQAVSGGQYQFPDGTFFGGQKATWSNQTFRAIVSKHGAKARRIGFIDFHTGLGPTGYGEPIYIGAPNSPGFDRARAWWGNDITSPEGGTSTSAVVIGTLRGGIEESLPNAEVTPIALEYGTIDLLDVLNAMRGDNWLYARGLKSGLTMESPVARDIKKKIRDALYVDTDDWKEKVYARGADFTLKAYRGLTA